MHLIIAYCKSLYESNFNVKALIQQRLTDHTHLGKLILLGKYFMQQRRFHLLLKARTAWKVHYATTPMHYRRVL